MIQNVVGVGPNGERQTLLDLERFVDRQVSVEVHWAAERVARNVAPPVDGKLTGRQAGNVRTIATRYTPAEEIAQDDGGGAVAEYAAGYTTVHHAVGLAAAGLEGLRDSPATDRRIQEAVR